MLIHADEPVILRPDHPATTSVSKIPMPSLVLFINDVQKKIAQYKYDEIFVPGSLYGEDWSGTPADIIYTTVQNYTTAKQVYGYLLRAILISHPETFKVTYRGKRSWYSKIQTQPVPIQEEKQPRQAMSVICIAQQSSDLQTKLNQLDPTKLHAIERSTLLYELRELSSMIQKTQVKLLHKENNATIQKSNS